MEPLGRRVTRLVRSLFRPRTVERELDHELTFHVEREIEERVRAGMPDAVARQTTLRDFGGVERFKDECRDVRAAAPLEGFGRDVSYALRSLRRSPGFTLVAIITIALGIGANTAIFSVLNGVLLRPLDYRDPDRLLAVVNTWEGRTSPSGSISPAEFFDYLERVTTVESFGVYGIEIVGLATGGEPERLPAAEVSAGVLRALDARPVIGRTIDATDDIPGSDVVLIAHGLWQRRFGGASSIIGSRIVVDGSPRTVIGVLPDGFRLPDDLASSTPSQIFEPLGLSRDSIRIRGSHHLSSVARLKPGVSIAQAEANVRSVAAQFRVDFPRDYPEKMGFSASAVALRETVVAGSRSWLTTLLGAVGFVLLIACVNVANLLLARAEGRQRETAVRLALGASTGRLVRQFLIEHLALAGLGGALGVVLAFAGARLLVATRPLDLPRIDQVGVDGQVLAFAFLATLVTGVLFGIVPALHTVRAATAGSRSLQLSIREGGRGSVGTSRRLRRMLVVSELSIAMVLLVASALLTKSLVRMVSVDPGFDVDHVLTVPITLPAGGYPTAGQVTQFFEQLDERVRGIPGVRSVGAVAGVPLESTRGDIGLTIEGRPVAPGESRPRADWQVVTPGYFRAIGMRMVRGREITAADGEGTPGVVVINEATAHRYWPTADPIGRRFTLGGGAGPGMVTIIGIVRDVHQAGLADTPEPEMYLAHTQFRFWGGGGVLRDLSLVVRTTGEPTALARAVRGEILALDAQLPVGTFRTMDQIRSASVARPRFVMMLVTSFSTVALVIAIVGVYGVMAYTAAQRRREFGVRLALGGQPRDIIGLVLREGMVLGVIGVGLGVLGALALTRTLTTFLFSVSPTDPSTFGAVAIVLMLVALAAFYVPARRATRVSPVEALRE